MANLRFGLRLFAIPCFGSVCVGSQTLIWLRAHPGDFCLCSQAAGHLSGRPPTQSFRCGPQATDWGTHPLGHFGSGAQAARPLIRVRAHPEFQLWAPSPLIWVRASRASGECRGCFSEFTVEGLRGEGRQRPRLLLRASIFFSFLRNSSYSSPPGPNKYLAAHTA